MANGLGTILRSPCSAGQSSGFLPPKGANESSVLGTQCSVLAGAAEALWNEPNNPALFQQLAAAAGQCELDEAELRLPWPPLVM